MDKQILEDNLREYYQYDYDCSQEIEEIIIGVDNISKVELIKLKTIHGKKLPQN